MSAPRLIGLCGLAGSGKSAVAAILERDGYTRLRFAAPLKAMLGVILAAAGTDNATITRMIEGDLKEAPAAILGGKTPRHAMQTLGKEWGRDLIHRDLWVGITMAKAAAILAQGGKVVIDDVRFLNEAAAVQGDELGHMRGVRALWRITGRGGLDVGRGLTHASEGQFLGHDLTLDNSGPLDQLHHKIGEAISG